MTSAARSIFPAADRLVTFDEEVEKSCKGMPKREWAVFPPARRIAAIADVATAGAIKLFCRHFARSALITNVFPVPARASTKKHSPVWFSTAAFIVSKTYF